MEKCQYCGKEYTEKGIGTHIWRSHGNGRNHDPNIGYSDGSRTVWNKGLSENDNPSVKKGANTLRDGLNTGRINPSFLGKKHSKKTLDRMSKNSGGYRKGAGRGKSGWYKGYWCDSTWELAWVIYNIDNEVTFERCPHKFEYEIGGTVHEYNPDFLVGSSYIIEIKGYETPSDIIKYTSVPESFGFNVLYYDDISPMIEYVIEKYGVSNLEDLYDNKGW